MPLKRKIALTAGGLIFFLLLLVSLFTGAYFYLPRYLESEVLPRLAADAGVSDFAVNVRNVGFFDADLGTLRIGTRENPALFVQSVQIDYSPWRLYQRKIAHITLSGIELYGEISNSEFNLRGLDFKKLRAGWQQRENSTAAHRDTAPKIAVQNLSIRNSQAIIKNKDQSYRVPVELDIVPQDVEFKLFTITVRMYPRGQKIAAAAKVNRTQSRVAVNVDAAALNLATWGDIFGRIADLNLTGEAGLHAKAEVLWAPFRLASMNASLTLQNTQLVAGGLEFQNARSPRNREIPWRIDLVGNDENQWQISCTRLSIKAPVSLTLDGVDAAFKKNAAGFEGTGNFKIVLHPSDQTGRSRSAVKIHESLPMQGRFSAAYHGPQKWQFQISNANKKASSTETARLSVGPYTITLPPPALNLSAAAGPEKIEAACLLAAPDLRIESASGSLYTPNFVFRGAADLAEADAAGARITFELQAPNTALTSNGLEIKIAEISASGKLNRDADRQISLTGSMQFEGGGQFSGLNARIIGARVKIPFKWPVEAKTEKGSISIAGLVYKDMNLGGLTGSIRQTATGFVFEGRHQSSLVPNLKMDFTGASRLFKVASQESSARVKISRPAGAPEIDLGKLMPEAKGFQINGKFGLEGDFKLNDRGFSGSLRADFNEGRLRSTQDKLALEGIHFSLNLPELPRIRSGPGQGLQFNKFSLGDLTVAKGGIDFQIESTRSFLVEKMHFRWCDGQVESQSMRLSPGIEDYRITFYCDRLNLAQVLEQFGAAAAEGGGTVNGRLPLRYANGKISFDDGFLFSTPGQGGKIRITGSDILTAGIPPDTPQYVQMELASEALKDYDYSWAKLNITSQGDELLLQMQMDGKPARTLPFVYRKDIGGFVKVEADAEGSKFQGIRLDVNFRLPLNKLLQYKDLFNMIKKSD